MFQFVLKRHLHFPFSIHLLTFGRRSVCFSQTLHTHTDMSHWTPNTNPVIPKNIYMGCSWTYSAHTYVSHREQLFCLIWNYVSEQTIHSVAISWTTIDLVVYFCLFNVKVFSILLFLIFTLWILFVHEMCIMNKPASPCLAMPTWIWVTVFLLRWGKYY